MLNTYRYKIEMVYSFNNTLVSIGSKNITSLMIDRDYDNKNSPVLIFKASLDKNLIDDMIKNSKNKTIKLTISKYISNSTSGIVIAEDYVKDTFLYFLSNDLNADKELDYSGATSNSTDILKDVSIGLVKNNLINNNKRLINDIFMNTSLVNIIQKYTSNMDILIEPMHNTIVNRLIVPPLASLTSFIQYVDHYYNLYSNSYRIFYDYNRTYLTSSSGKSTLAKNESIGNIIINVDSNSSPTSKAQGMNIDNRTNTCTIDINDADVNIFQDTVTDRSYNKIIGIDTNGNTKEVKVDLNNDDKRFEKVRLERVSNGNLSNLNGMKSNIENSSLYVNIVKAELDTSLLTINRSYSIKNSAKLTISNGNFLLARKREIFTPEDHNFILSSILNFRKAIS